MQSRISFVVGNLSFGGATTLLLNLAAGLQKLGIPIRIDVLDRENAFPKETEAIGPCVFSQDASKNIFEYRIAAALKGIASFKPTAVIGWLGPSSYEVLRYIPQDVLRLAVIHCDDPNFFRAVEPYTGNINGIVAVSEEIQRKMAQMPAFASLPIQYLPNGAVFPKKLPESANRETQPLRILYFGRLENQQKRVRLFPQILEELKNSGIPFQWTIAGSGPEETFLEENLKTDRPNQRVLLLGEVAYQQVPNLITQNDIFLLASDKEGLPMALLEAMGHGLVPVVSDLPSGIKEVVDSSNGILVPIDKVAEYAHGIIWLHEHREALERMRKAAHDRVSKEHSIETMSSRWLGHLQSQLSHTSFSTWPKKFSLKPPIQLQNAVSYWPGFRPFRQLSKRILSCAFGKHRVKRSIV